MGLSTPNKRFVVLDRDGTIIEEKHYLADPEQVVLLPGAVEGLRRFQEMGLGLAVVTNQSGVGRGYFNLDILDQIHQRMNELLNREGINIEGIYFCPHTPTEMCACRKPEPGLIDQASQELYFDTASCFVIGDKAADIELGERVGATTFLVSTGYGTETAQDASVQPNHYVEHLNLAADVIEGLLQKAKKAKI